jgi:hypothetical protein
MRKFAMVALVAVALAGLSGCETEQKQMNDQHHKFALQGCVDGTLKADAALVEMDSIEEPKTNPSTDPLLTQRQHDWRAAQCMSVEEKTTIAFQQAKHDDYGKCDQCAREAVERGRN